MTGLGRSLASILGRGEGLCAARSPQATRPGACVRPAGHEPPHRAADGLTWTLTAGKLKLATAPARPRMPGKRRRAPDPRSGYGEPKAESPLTADDRRAVLHMLAEGWAPFRLIAFRLAPRVGRPGLNRGVVRRALQDCVRRGWVQSATLQRASSGYGMPAKRPMKIYGLTPDGARVRDADIPF